MKNYYLEKLYKDYLKKGFSYNYQYLFEARGDIAVVNNIKYYGHVKYHHYSFEDFEKLYEERKEELLLFLM